MSPSDRDRYEPRARYEDGMQLLHLPPQDQLISSHMNQTTVAGELVPQDTEHPVFRTPMIQIALSL